MAVERKMPINQLIILSLCRFAEPITYTAASAYLPSMLSYLGVSTPSIGRWAGISAFLFNFFQCVTAMFWGLLSDRVGRKPIIMVCLAATMTASLSWGFSTSLAVAMTSRALLGAFGGNTGILRTAVAEVVPWKELQPKAFAIMPALYNIGCVLGPIIGGTLANPYHVSPDKPHGNRLLERFPFALPNIIASVFFFAAIVAVWLGLNETLITKRGKRDLGIMMREKIARKWQEWKWKPWVSEGEKEREGEEEPLLGSAGEMQDEDEGVIETHYQNSETEGTKKAVKWKDILTRQSMLCLGTYSMLGLQSGVFDMFIPVFMHHPRQDPSTIHLPFQFSGGFSATPETIGALFAIIGIITVPIQFLFYPWLASRIGVLSCLRITAAIYPLLYIFFPFITLLPTPTLQYTSLFIFVLIKGCCTSFGYPCATVMLSQSIEDTRGLGTLNGILTMSAGAARAIGPAIGGVAFSLGVNWGFLVVPFWICAGMAGLAMVPVFLLKEDPRKGKKGVVGEEEEEEA